MQVRRACQLIRKRLILWQLDLKVWQVKTKALQISRIHWDRELLWMRALTVKTLKDHMEPQ